MSKTSSSGLVVGITIAAFFTCAMAVLQIALPLYSMQIFDRVIPSGKLATLLYLSLIMFALIVCSVIVDGCRTEIFSRISIRIDLMLYKRACAAALDNKAPDIEALRDAESIRSFTASSLAATIFDAPCSIAFTAAIFCLHPFLGWLTIGAIALVLLVGGTGHLVTRTPRIEASERTDASYAVLQSARERRDIIDAMGLKAQLLAGVLRYRNMARLAIVKVNDRQGWLDALGRGTRCAVQVAVLAVAAFLVVTHDVKVGSIVASSMLFGRAISPAERLGASIVPILHFFSACRRSIKKSHAVIPAPSKLSLPQIRGALSAENLSFVPAGELSPVVKAVSFSLDPGKVLAIVGPEGSGKSTLARLLVGALPPSSGVVRLDGTNLCDFDARELGQQTGFLSEGAQLGIGTVAEIVARGEEPIAGEVIAAAILAGAHSMIQHLPHGYQTPIWDGGNCLSAGQRQRIALARAYYRMPPFVVLDEPTAHLDDAGEMNLAQAVESFKKQKCTLVLVSRLPALLHLADHLMMLENGEVRLLADQSRLQNFLKPRLATSV